MKHKLLLSSILAILASPLQADLYLPKVIADHMVLQRNAPIPIWGWDNAGQTVTVNFAGETKEAIADANGKWTIELSSLPANATPQSMVIQGSTSRTLSDILVGEVWLASGQSNMEWSFNQITEEEKEFAKAQADNTLIRTFHASEHVTSGYPLQESIGKWKTCKDTLGSVTQASTSAVGFFFALKLQEELNVPIGILDINWGGMRIECFIPESGYKAEGLHLRTHHRKPDNAYYISILQSRIAHFQQALKLVKEEGIQTPIQFSDNPQGWAENMIYNSMIAPTTPFAINGVIWYQGESNRGDSNYFDKLKALQTGLSNVYKKDNLPLYQVQIAPYAYTTNLHDTTLCDTIWKAQYKAAKELDNVEVVPSHDTNINIRDIHPQHKLPIGNRLAKMALNRLYHKPNTIADAPTIAAASYNNGEITLTFNGIDQGLTTNDNQAPSWFEESFDGINFTKISGAKIVGNTVSLHSLLQHKPTHIRMGWAETAIPNLSDKNGLPVLSFPGLKITY